MSSSQLDSAFEAFVTWQTLLFCLGIAILTYVIRTIVESVWKSAKANDIWNEVGVRLGPIGTGVILVFTSKTFPWPTQILGSKLGMAFYGAACGVASAYVYAAFQAWVSVAAKNGFAPAQSLMKKKVEAREKAIAHKEGKAAEKAVADAVPVTVDATKADDRPTPTDDDKKAN